MTFCIPKFKMDEIRAQFKSGKLNPTELAQLTSAERRARFTDLVGEVNAKEMNALFESKLLLKNQQLGMINWANKILGLSKEARRDIIAKIESLDRVIEGAELDTFLEDLVAKRLGIEVTVKEAGQLLQLTKEIRTLKEKIEPSMPDGAPERLEYGVKAALLKKLVEDLKLGERRSIVAEFASAPIKELTNLSKGLRFTLDNSFWGNQGIGALTSIKYTDLWAKNTVKSIKDIVGTLWGKDMMLATQADIFSRKNALNNKYKDSKLAVGIGAEEAFPESVLMKIPLIKRIAIAADTAYNAGALRLRADIFDRIIKNRERYDGELSKADLEGLGESTNVLTGRASLGSWEGASKELSIVFTSAKFIKSQFDTMTAGLLNKKIKGSNIAVKESATNIAGMIMSTASLMVLANTLWPGSVETDPRSSDFGKIKIPVGNGKYARIGFTGGKSSMVVLAARLATNQIKTGGKLKNIGEKYGDPDRLDYFYNYLTSKFAPIPGAFATMWRGRTFEGEKPTIGKEAFKTVLPLSIESSMDLYAEGNADALLYTLLNGLGFNTTVY